MSWWIGELNQRAIFCAIREYITSPNYGEEAAERDFFKDLKGLNFWGEEPATLDDEQLQNTVKTLRGEIRRDWKREDFLISNANCEDNVYLFNDAKGMAGLKAHEFFSSFMHQKGIITDKELRKIERVIEELNVPLRKFYERNRWKYRFLEAWR